MGQAMTYTCPNCKTERVTVDCAGCVSRLADDYQAEKKRADEAEAKLADVVELLRMIQWRGGDDGECVTCDAKEYTTHEDECPVGALIGKAGA